MQQLQLRILTEAARREREQYRAEWLLGWETPEHVYTAGHSMSTVTQAKHRQEMHSVLVQSPRKADVSKAETKRLAFAKKNSGGVIRGGNQAHRVIRSHRGCLNEQAELGTERDVDFKKAQSPNRSLTKESPK